MMDLICSTVKLTCHFAEGRRRTHCQEIICDVAAVGGSEMVALVSDPFHGREEREAGHAEWPQRGRKKSRKSSE